MLLAIKNVTIDSDRAVIHFCNGEVSYKEFSSNVSNLRVLFVEKYGFALAFEDKDGYHYSASVWDNRMGELYASEELYDPTNIDVEQVCRSLVKDKVSGYETEEQAAINEKKEQQKLDSFEKKSPQQKATWAETNELKNARNTAIILALAECAAAYYFFTNGYPVLSIVIGLVALVLTIMFRKIVFRSLRVLVVGGIPATILVIGGGAIKDGEGSDYLIHGIILAVLWFAFAIYLEVKGKLRRKKPAKHSALKILGNVMDSVANSSGGNANTSSRGAPDLK